MIKVFRKRRKRPALKDVVWRVPSYVVKCADCGIEVHAQDLNRLLDFCCDWQVTKEESIVDEDGKMWEVWTLPLCPRCQKRRGNEGKD